MEETTLRALKGSISEGHLCDNCYHNCFWICTSFGSGIEKGEFCSRWKEKVI